LPTSTSAYSSLLKPRCEHEQHQALQQSSSANNAVTVGRRLAISRCAAAHRLKSCAVSMRVHQPQD
jgi:hypothetical protein